jgi:hypothetical protein
MSIGAFTKQFAQQALKDQVKDVVDALRPPDLASIAEGLTGAKSAPPPADAPTGMVILGQLQAMQKALKDDEELVLLCTVGLETLRVLEVFLPSWRVVVLTGIDTDKKVTRIISPLETLQFVCKPVPVQAPAAPARIRFIAPKPNTP